MNKSPSQSLSQCLMCGALFMFVVACVSNVRAASPGHGWNEMSTKLSALARQIESKEQEMRQLISDKRAMHDDKKLADIIHEMGELQKSLEAVGKDYEAAREQVRFEFPERNDVLERVYVRHQIQSIEDLERELGIDSRLDSAKIRVLAIFPLPEKSPTHVTPDETPRRPASIPDEDQVEKIRLIK